jgi:hypothetical protein
MKEIVSQLTQSYNPGDILDEFYPFVSKIGSNKFKEK